MNQLPEKHLPASAEEWLVHARSDLKLAKLGKGQRDILPQQICFHAQQAVEKTLKAVLLYSSCDFPLTHDIVQLLDILDVAGISLPQDFKNAGVLTPYAVETRYPGFIVEVTEHDVDEALTLAEKVTSWAEAYITGE